MANIEIIELRKTDSGEIFYPLTHVDAVIGLTDRSFFQLDESGNVTLRPEYQNLWVPGWIADGGIGSGGGGGGGGSSTLYGLNDVSIPQPPSAPSANDILSYSTSLGKWTNVAKATFLSGYAEQSWVQSWVQQQGYLLPSALNPYALSSSLATVATTGNYSDLNGLPTLPSAPGTLVTNNSTAQTASPGESLSQTINLHKIAKTGNYGDLIDRPTNVSAFNNDAGYLTSFTETDPTVPSWAKASSKPSYSLNEISGTDDLQLIEALTGGGLLRRNGTNNTWSLDSTEYLPFVGWLGGSDNLNNCTFGSWVYSSSPSNYPGSVGGGQLLALGTDSSGYGKAQMAINTSGVPYFRIAWTSWTAWREAIVSGVSQTIAGAKTFSDNMTLEGTLTLSGSTKKIAFGSFYIELQDLGSGNYALHTNAPFYSDQWIADGGIGSGSGGGSASVLNDLNDVTVTSPAQDNVLVYDYSLSHWVNVSKASFLSGYATTASLATVATSGSYNDLSNRPSIPDESTVSGWGFTKNAGTVTSVAMTLPTGLSVSGSPITSSGTLAVTFTNGYSIPTTAKQGNWDTAYSTVTGSQTKNKVFASPSNASGAPSFRSLVAADIPNLNASKITEGTLDFARLPSMYIGRNSVASSAGDVTLLGITGFTTASSASASGDTSLVVWEPNGGGTGVGAWHFKGNIVADGWIADGGIGSGSSGGMDVARMWQSLTNTPPDQGYENTKIALAHIPTIPYTNISGTPTLATVATSGSYNDLTNTPTIPTVPTNVSAFTNDAGYLTDADLGEEEHDIWAGELWLGDGWLEEDTYPPTQKPRPAWNYRSGLSTVTDFVALVSDIPSTLDDVADGSTRSLANYLPLAGGTMTGAITMSSANIVPSADGANKIGNTGARFLEGHIRNLFTSYFQFRDGSEVKVGQIAFGSGYGDFSLIDSGGNTLKDYAFYTDKFFVRENGETTASVDLGTYDHRWKRIYGIDGNFNGDLKLSGTTKKIYFGDTYYIELVDLGSGNTPRYALHTNAPLYSDSWIADGGIQQTS